ncbi:DNA methyltransferase [Micromonospora sp. WMMD956]|uniref:TRM11 family SAM-dependent methyltransferase n=1 Tax=Micromonospora sp. WMMD956 TaxID=3016108 RepID=UPI002416C290|nr:DNA methyltransferase [Micromonospora sp. WMMD956]MDG4813930.1 DNA methyltransferase [Micromonospora sp. WMMD956]MDG4813947.1 DNA methyltransferase [Micromonospora sp. WMMD956]MDG4820247.1 DNA methyltransferase [Micromonospora sp. WMMD956]
MDEPMPVTSVWLTCQQPARDQRRGRYVPETSSHPGKMLPHLAAHAISSYTAPGDLVFDPMCGSGTTLVEAMHLGRQGIGIDIEPRFTGLAASNVALAASQGATGSAQVFTGDATGLLDLVPASVVGRVGLVLTSPPYGRGTHGLVRATSAGVRKRYHVYGDRERGNLAYGGWFRLFDGFAAILAASHRLLRPGGTVVITCRPVRRRRDDLIDLPGQLLAVARSVGLVPVQRCAAMLAAVRDGQIVHRANMFGLLAVRRARDEGIPVHLIAHEDVLVLRRC